MLALTVINLIILISIGLIALLGNGLILIAWMTQASLRSPQNALIVSLAFSDFLVGLVIIPTDVLVELNSWSLGLVMCQIKDMLMISVLTVSIFHLIAIAWDRYKTIVYGIQYIQRRTMSTIIQVIASLWVMAFWIGLPLLLDTRFWNNSYNNCIFKPNLAFVMYSAIGSFVFPMVLLTKLYWNVYKAIQERLHKKNFCESQPVSTTDGDLNSTVIELHGHSDNRHPADYGSPTPTRKHNGHHHHNHAKNLVNAAAKFGFGNGTSVADTMDVKKQNKISIQKEKRAFRTLGVIILAFVVCWIPFFLIYVINVFITVPHDAVAYYTLFKYLSYLGRANSIINPFIYAIFNKEFMAAFSKLLPCCSFIFNKL